MKEEKLLVFGLLAKIEDPPFIFDGEIGAEAIVQYQLIWSVSVHSVDKTRKTDDVPAVIDNLAI